MWVCIDARQSNEPGHTRSIQYRIPYLHPLSKGSETHANPLPCIPNQPTSTLIHHLALSIAPLLIWRSTQHLSRRLLRRRISKKASSIRRLLRRRVVEEALAGRLLRWRVQYRRGWRGFQWTRTHHVGKSVVVVAPQSTVEVGFWVLVDPKPCWRTTRHWDICADQILAVEC